MVSRTCELQEKQNQKLLFRSVPRLNNHHVKFGLVVISIFYILFMSQLNFRCESLYSYTLSRDDGSYNHQSRQYPSLGFSLVLTAGPFGSGQFTIDRASFDGPDRFQFNWTGCVRILILC